MNEVNATPHEELIADLMNPNKPRSELGHAAVREIERLREVLKLALEALKKSDGFIYNWHENSSDDEADAYDVARQLNRQAIIAAEKALKQPQPNYLEIPGMRIDPVTGNVGIGSLPAQPQKEPAYRAVKTFHEGKPVYVAQPQQEPVAYWIPKAEQFCIAGPSGRPFAKAWEPLYTSPPQRKPLNGVLVPLNVLEAVEKSLGSFCSDHGWADEDMQNMDNLSAYISEHKAAHGIKE